MSSIAAAFFVEDLLTISWNPLNARGEMRGFPGRAKGKWRDLRSVRRFLPTLKAWVHTLQYPDKKAPDLVPSAGAVGTFAGKKLPAVCREHITIFYIRNGNFTAVPMQTYWPGWRAAAYRCRAARSCLTTRSLSLAPNPTYPRSDSTRSSQTRRGCSASVGR